MGEKIKTTPLQIDKEKLPSRSTASIFLEDALIPAIMMGQEEAQPNVSTLITLLDKFRKDNLEIGDTLSLEDIYSEVSSRIFDKYAPGNFSPFVVAKAYELVEEAINIIKQLSQTIT